MSRCLFLQLKGLGGPPSRALSAELDQIYTAQPKVSLQFALVPVLQDASTGPYFGDYVTRLCKGALASHQNDLLALVLASNAQPWSENVIGVLQRLLTTARPPLSALSSVLEAQASHHADSKKFGALLLLVCTQHLSKSAEAASVERLRRAVEAHTTFMKRACLAQLDKLTA